MSQKREIYKFSIRKYSVGVASVLLGLFVATSIEVPADQVMDKACIQYRYVAEDELTDSEKQLIVSQLPSQ